ncbi:uncharacterized protein K452DRAFT_17668 [Aplosporella prunicola CBS 121167]|uniref:Uncharacterized protein n=1 Tax=Aplosporella prunicola CBS 121167 TaxID=1176127 RepID=A0A6A6BDV6_9PEZI|nr:uncharacterized protein K452DRAFT_17668 [Aplosporella prunicola CBS 121167]KAF2142372.1 hypothetical protein K452DRAFT_17668 [Aplosporella prunicola CBS 121167]
MRVCMNALWWGKESDGAAVFCLAVCLSACACCCCLTRFRMAFTGHGITPGSALLCFAVYVCLILSVCLFVCPPSLSLREHAHAFLFTWLPACLLGCLSVCSSVAPSLYCTLPALDTVYIYHLPSPPPPPLPPSALLREAALYLPV